VDGLRRSGVPANLRAVTDPIVLDGLRPVDADDGDLRTLTAFLNWMRESVIVKATGVTEEQGRGPAVASGTSLFGLVKHLAVAESYWFDVVFQGVDAPIDFTMQVSAEETGPALIARYREAIGHSNAIIAACGDAEARSVGPPGPARSLRWIITHMIQETARHAGHADILRENLDGSVGHRLPS